MLNTDLHSPTFWHGAQPALGTVLNPTLRGVDVLSAGVVKITDIEGQQRTYTFYDFDPQNGGPVSQIPCRLEIQIRSVDADTTASLVYLR